jgi:CRISPR/Cas system-associated endoribonuclease Cas2
MEENKIYLLNQIDLDKIIYSKVNEMNDKKLIHIHYEKVGQKLLFQTPQLLNIFDIQKNQYFNQLILPLHDCNLKVPMLIKFLKDLDLKIINDAKKNKNEWFKNKTAIKYKSLIKNLYTSNSQSNHYSPTKEDEKYCENGLIKLKLTNGIKILEKDCNNKEFEIKLDDLKKQNFMRLIVELYAVWVSKDVFGIYLKPVMVEQIQNKVLNFIDEKEDITDVNYMETEANSDDEYIDNNELQLVSRRERMERSETKPKADNLNYKNNINNINENTDSEESIENLKLDNNTKMFQFGLHNVNDDFFNRVKKDNKIVSILSELNSNNTKKNAASLSEDSDDKNSPKVQPKNIGFNVNDIVNGLKLEKDNKDDEDDDEETDEEEEEEVEEEEEEEKEEEEGGKKLYSETSYSDDIKYIKQNVNNESRRRNA